MRKIAMSLHSFLKTFTVNYLHYYIGYQNLNVFITAYAVDQHRLGTLAGQAEVLAHGL